MTAHSFLTRWSVSAALLAVAAVLAQSASFGLPSDIAVVSAQGCSPQIGIDSPATGDTVSGVTTFSGWAVDLSSPAGSSGVDSVRLYQDAPPEEGGTGLAVATIGIPRPDIDAANGLTNSMSGWSADVDFSNSPSEDATIYVYAHTLCGWTYATQAVTISGSSNAGAPAPSAISISLDSPSAGASITEGQTLDVAGWAVDTAGAGTGVDSVKLYLDGPADGGGRPLGFAVYGKARPDVAASSGNPDWTRSGFDLSWAVSNVSPGSHVLYIYAHSIDSDQWDYTTLPIVVGGGATSAGAYPGSNPAISQGAGATSANAVIRVESPTGAVNGPTVLSGYAVDCGTGSPPADVRVYSGTNTSGKLLGTAIITGARDLSSVCSTGVSGSATIGFSFNLDPSTLTPGSQAVTVVADTTAGPVASTVNLAGGNTSAGTGGGTNTTARCSSGSSSAGYNPFVLLGCSSSSSSSSASTSATQNSSGAQYNPNGQGTTQYNCNPNYSGQQQGYPYANQYQNQGYPNNVPCTSNTTASSPMNCNPSYPNPNPSYPNNVPCTVYNSGTNATYNNNGYNSYTGAYSSTNPYTPPSYNTTYPYESTTNYNYGTNGYNYQYGTNGYNYGYPNGYNGYGGYNNYNYGNNYGYNPGYNYGYGYNPSYNPGYNYGYNYGYNPGYTSNPYAYGGSGYGYGYNGGYGTGAGNFATLPPGYNYIYAGNAGGPSYGQPYGYGYGGYPGGYGYGGYGYGGYPGGYGYPY